jgi:hypothetical protein
MVQKSAPTEAQRRNGTNLAILERHNGTSLRCSAIRRTGEPTTRAAAPNQALHVGIFGMAGRGGAAECQLDCRSAPVVFSQSTMSEIESFRATLAALRAALPLARQFPLREPSEGPLYRRPAPPKALQGASERRELSVKARLRTEAQKAGTARGTSLHCRHRERAGKPSTRAAAPDQALHVGIFGMAGRGGAAECQRQC